ncbi:MAG TPA: hypothetical protein PK907_08485, partial [Candidatus Sabulitectum sp.]|nr:hypothetical protein [Candidatus Sabulitectum sp.]
EEEPEPQPEAEPETEGDQEEEDEPAEIVVEVPVEPEPQAEEAPEEPAAEEPEPEPEPEPEKEPEPDEEQPVEETSYELLPGDASSLCAMRVDSGRVMVTVGLVTAVSGDVNLEDGVISGAGMAWMGQGDLNPVIIDYAPGITVRIDKLAVRPEAVGSVSAGVPEIPSLRKLQGECSCSLLLFTAGRRKNLTVVPGLRVKAGSILAADPDVSFSSAGNGFLEVTGSGKVVITG